MPCADLLGTNTDAGPADVDGSIDAGVVLLLPLLPLVGLSFDDMLVLLCLSTLFVGELVDGVEVVGSSLPLVLLVFEGLGSSGLTNRDLSPLLHTEMAELAACISVCAGWVWY